MPRDFNSFGAFADHLVGVVAAQAAMEHRALEKAAQVIERRAKERIGEYQGQAGEFVAWAELADSTQAQREHQGFTPNDPGLRTGQMRDSIEHQVQVPEAVIGSNDPNLEYFELGTSKQPPRSVLGGAAVESVDQVIEIIGDEVMVALVGEQVFRRRIPIRE